MTINDGLLNFFPAVIMKRNQSEIHNPNFFSWHMRLKWKILPLFPPFNFHFFVRSSPVKGKCHFGWAARLQPCPLGVWLWVEGDLSGLIKEQMSPPYHEPAPFSETSCKKGLQLRETYSSGGTKPPRLREKCQWAKNQLVTLKTPLIRLMKFPHWFGLVFLFS